MEMNEALRITYQNQINYSNADSMFAPLDQIIRENGRDFILRRNHETEEDCVRSYVLRCNAMRYASDAIEHYAKAILIQNGHTWIDSKSWGHNLLELFNNLDSESKSIVISTLLPSNRIDKLANTNTYYDFDNIVFYLFKELDKLGLINNKEDFDHIEKDGELSKTKGTRSSEEEQDSYENAEINNDRISNEIMNLDYNNALNDIIIREKGKTQFHVVEIPQTGNIVGIKPNQTVEGELQVLFPTPPPRLPGMPRLPRDQDFGVKARFPGQYLVDGNAEFLISLAYTMHELSKIQRAKVLPPQQTP